MSNPFKYGTVGAIDPGWTLGIGRSRGDALRQKHTRSALVLLCYI